jgi:3-carboxy-cis,cis-muconate cycloisomerase
VCREVNEHGGTLADALARHPGVTRHLDRATIDRLADPANYLGMAQQMVDRAVEASRRQGF